ncbi:MAG: LacI family DNA-binding transcriptional regulator [Terracidiphilus sp.]
MPRPPSPARRQVPEKDKRLSLRELADHLGLSRTTVSLVLNNSPVAEGLSAETRERVRSAAVELNYRPNYFARVLKKKRSHMVGVLSSDLNAGYNSELLTAMERLFIERNYLYFVSGHHWSKALIDERIQVFAERGAEGIVLINTPVQALPALPLVSIGAFALSEPATRILIDNAAGARMALEHLHALGHRRIAFFVGHEGSSDTEARWLGCQQACRELGLTLDPALVTRLERIRVGLDPIQEGRAAAGRLLAAGRPFSALLAFNDLSAIGAMQALREAGLRVPEDLSVVGFDDVLAAVVVQPPLTTVRQPLRQMGALAGAELLARMEDPHHPIREHLIEPELVVRGSTARRRVRRKRTI